MIDKNTKLNKIVSYKNTDYKIFHDLMLSPVIFKYSDLNNIYCNITIK
jgi:hypothetical protein